MSIREFFLFKDIADFLYEFRISKGEVFISANIELLEEIGY